MTFRSNWDGKGVEEYYQKFIELQERLQKSEEERLQLEMKFNEMIQVTQEEEQLYYKRLKSQYKRFLDENHKRQERNEKILYTLERIESRAAIMEAKSKRLKLLRHQYHSYLDRVERQRNLLDKQVATTKTENAATLGEIIDQQLPNRVGNVQIDDDLGSADQLFSRFKNTSNGASIADDIMRSIYERNKKKHKKGFADTRRRNVRIDDESDDSNTESNCIDDDDTKFSRSRIDVENIPNENVHNTKQNQLELETFEEPLETSSPLINSREISAAYAEMDSDILKDNLSLNNTKESNEDVIKNNIDLNQNMVNLDHINVEDVSHQKSQEALNLNQDIRTTNTIIEKHQDEESVPSIDQIGQNGKDFVNNENPGEELQIEPNTNYNGSLLETQQIANEVFEVDQYQVNEELKPQDITVTNEKIKEDQKVDSPEVEVEAEVEQQTYEQPALYENQENVDLNQEMQEPLVETNQQVEQTEDSDRIVEQIEQVEQSDAQLEQQQAYEEQDLQNQPNQPQYDENGQLLYDQSNMQYDESGQPIQYDANGQQIYYDENGQPMHYDENTQQYQYDQSQYDENGQAIAYDQNYENYQQYDENGQIINYEQPKQEQEQEQVQGGGEGDGGDGNMYYDENGQPVTYEETDQAPNQQEQIIENGNENKNVPGNEQEQNNETSDDVVQDSDATGIEQQEEEPAERKANVLEFLDTESESTQNQPDKAANESDFDFSSTSDPKLPSQATEK